MESIQNRIQYLKENGYRISFADTFSDAFKIYQNVFLYGALAFFIFAVYSWVISLGAGYLPFMQDAQSNMQETLMDSQGDMQVIREAYIAYFSNREVLFVTVFSMFFYALIFPIIAGIINVAYQYDKTGDTNIAYLFEGFNGNNFGRLMILYLLYTVAKIVGLFVLGVGFFIPFVGFSIASCFVMINDMKVMDAIKASFTVTFKNFFVILFLLIVSFLFAFLGFFACIVGALFTLPLTTVMCYAIYKNSVGIDNSDGINEIGLENNSQ